jgi:uncharacterized damage-inducible protein DinB
MTPEERKQKIISYGAANQQLVEALKKYPKKMWKYKPGPERWSIHEIILHLADSETNSHIRCRRCIAESGKSVMAYDEDQWAISLHYHDQSAEDALELFKLLRQMSCNLIETLPASAWSNTINHPEGGIMTLDDWLNIYVNHIAEHIQQMQATYDAWVAEQKGQSPDPEKPLFKFSK